MRFLAALTLALTLAGPAAAATPRFGLFDLQTDLAKASRNKYGDVRISTSRVGLESRAVGSTLVRCAAGCRFGPGWLALHSGPALSAADVVSVKAHLVRGTNWGLTVRLSAKGQARWRAFAKQANRNAAMRGVPDLLLVVVDGTILAQPYASDVSHKQGTLELDGFTRANARKAAKTLG